MIQQSRVDGRDLLIAAAFALVVLVVEALIAARLDIAGVFDQYDAVFDTDPVFWHRVFAHGWDRGDVYHPLLTYYFSIPNRAVAWLASIIGIAPDEFALRRSLGVFVAPVVTGIKIGVLYLVFRKLDLQRFLAVAGAAFAALAFSSLVFGALPESYAVTGMAFSLVILYALSDRTASGPLHVAGQVALTIFTIGITISNVIFCGWAEFARRMHRIGMLNAFLRAVAVCALALLLAVGGGVALNLLRGPDPSNPPAQTEASGPSFLKFTNPPAVAAQNFIEMPAFLAMTVVPVVPGQTGNEIAEASMDRHRLQFTYNDSGGWRVALLAVAGLLGFGGGAIIAHRAGGAWRIVAWSSLLSILSYGLLYSYFGRNTYLYSQVWYVPCVLLAAAWLRLDCMRTRVAKFCLAAMLGLMLAANLWVLAAILEVLSASP